MTQTLAKLSQMTQYRRIREVESRSKIPDILWVLLILCGATTTLSACLFGTGSFKLHAMQVFSLSLLLSVALVAIADIDRPFQGAVNVTPVGFERARQTFAEFKAAHK